MTENEHMLMTTGEEALETAHRVSKAMRFGLDEVQPGQALNNAERLVEEYSQLTAMMEMLYENWLIPQVVDRNEVLAKKAKYKQFLVYAREQGTVQDA